MNKIKPLSNFAIIIIIFLLINSCGLFKKNPVEPSGTKNYEEPVLLKQSAKTIDTALFYSDTKTLKSYILPKFLNIYSSSIDSSSDKLKGFGDIFKTRKLVALDSIFAVYQIDYNGKKFEINFTVDDDGTWKLMNF